MTKTVDKTVNDVIGILTRIGSMSKQEIIGLAPEANHHVLAKRERTGYIRLDKDERAGRKRIGEGPDKSLVQARTHSHNKSKDTYDGAELRPCSVRAGSMDAFALPSRMPDGLHYRNGKVAQVPT